MIHCEAMKKITTWTYLKLLASPVSFVARNLYSVELAVHGPNIPWLYRFCAGKWQQFFLKEKGKKKKPAPACNELLWSECNNCWDSQQCTGNYSLPASKNEKDNPYTTSLWYMTHTMLVSSLMKSTTPSTSFCENASCIYSLYLCPLNEWSIAWNWISSRMAWDALPCLLEKPHRPRLLMGDISNDYSFGLEVTDIYASNSLERGSQSTD